MNVINVKERITKDEAAKMLGLKVYDTALPQKWLNESCQTLLASKDDEVPQNIYDTFCGGVVWCYDNAPYFGEPVALTDVALHALMKLAFWSGWSGPQQNTVLHIEEGKT